MNRYIAIGRGGVADKVYADGFFTRWGLRFIVPLLNGLLYVKGILSSRKQSYFFHLIMRPTEHRIEKFRWNISNGTCVVISEKKAYKLFFKNIGFNTQLYHNLEVALNIKLYARENFLLLVQPRFSGNLFEGTFYTIVQSEDYKKLRSISKFDGIEFDKRLLGYCSQNPFIEPIQQEFLVEASRFLTSTIKKYGTCSINHGDIWKDNVIDTENGVKLIDYDKVVFASQYYDKAYYKYMNNESLRKKDPWKLLSEMSIAIEKYSACGQEESLEEILAFCQVILTKAAEYEFISQNLRKNPILVFQSTIDDVVRKHFD